jgi:phosphoglycerol transferase MdoB-like AlkP superfamily enzyme
MAGIADKGGGAGRNMVRLMLWSVAAGLLLVPLIAMQFTREVNWTGSDFLFAGMMIGGAGLLFELAVRRSPSSAYRAAIALALAAAFLIVWANGAVGMIGNQDNPYNLLFVGVIGLAAAGAVVARFRASGMAVAMLAAGAVHAGVALFGMAADLRGGVFSLGFAGLWLLSAALFRKAATNSKAPLGSPR